MTLAQLQNIKFGGLSVNLKSYLGASGASELKHISIFLLNQLKQEYETMFTSNNREYRLNILRVLSHIESLTKIKSFVGELQR